jgi:hypothetical protein
LQKEKYRLQQARTITGAAPEPMLEQPGSFYRTQLHKNFIYDDRDRSSFWKPMKEEGGGGGGEAEHPK